MDEKEIRARLRDRIDQGKSLSDVGTYNLEERKRDYTSWNDYVVAFLERRIGSGEAMAFEEGSDAPSFERDYGGFRERDWLRELLKTKVQRLESIVDRLELLLENPGATSAGPETHVPLPGKHVFIVHGHRTSIMHEAVRVVTALTKQQPIVLQEQADKGQTIIEKLENSSKDVGFAVVLLTADDMGRAAGDSEETPRARQNVVLEFGYFLAKLGRSQVVVLYEPGVELPSDIKGVLYTEIDSGGGWRIRLGGEMKAAGMDADLNRLVG